MKKLRKLPIPSIEVTAQDLLGQKYLPVREAAEIMGISTRSVYGYIEDGKIPAYRIGSMFVVESEHVHNYERQAVGRRRTRIPIWHIPPALNAQYLTSISVRIRQGQGERLEQKNIARRNHHHHQ